jgi:anti-sigma factor ChrR (cupin superfamily)
MGGLHVITPVRDAVDLTFETVQAVLASQGEVVSRYTLYDDFSSPESVARLKWGMEAFGYGLVHLSELTTHRPPNYLLALQLAQQEALAEEAALCIVESDVVVQPDTLRRLFEESQRRPHCGLAAAVTVDEEGHINYPYRYARRRQGDSFVTHKHVSFCCTVLTPEFLRAFDFGKLGGGKSWYDVTVSHASLKMGFRNYLFADLPALHRPHGSRPWKALKYAHPVRYYMQKWFLGRDKI